jgi:hypothetical protein
MSTTAQWIFNAAIFALDEQDDTGTADHEDTEDYKNRSISILNSLIAQTYHYSDGYTVATAGSRPIPALVAGWTDDVPVDDILARTALPYGLAYMLVLSDRPALANNLKLLYDEALSDIRSRIPGESEQITDLYGITGYSDE